jgi:hypothetical protein
MRIIESIQNDILIPNHCNNGADESSAVTYDDDNDDIHQHPIIENGEINEGTTIGIQSRRSSSSSSSSIQQQWLPCHIIDLHPEGELNAHVDSIRYSGNIVAGLSLLSDSIMRLRPSSSSDNTHDNTPTNDTSSSSLLCGVDDHYNQNDAGRYVDLYLPINSFYVLSDMSRYEYTHELLPTMSYFRKDDHQQQQQLPVIRSQRYSIIFRNALTTTTTTNTNKLSSQDSKSVN